MNYFDICLFNLKMFSYSLQSLSAASEKCVFLQKVSNKNWPKRFLKKCFNRAAKFSIEIFYTCKRACISSTNFFINLHFCVLCSKLLSKLLLDWSARYFFCKHFFLLPSDQNVKNCFPSHNWPLQFLFLREEVL